MGTKIQEKNSKNLGTKVKNSENKILERKF
jgi:hypothetical protein